MQHFVQHGIAGESSKKHGPDRGIHQEDFKILVRAYESYVRIKQINAETADNTCSNLAKHSKNAMNVGTITDWLLRKSQENNNVELKAGPTKPQEEG